MAPDNLPVPWRRHYDGITLQPAIDTISRIAKTIWITMHGRGGSTIKHRLTNRGKRKIELALWAINVMAPGGEAIIPQEPYPPHRAQKTLARPVVLWSCTRMDDARLNWGREHIRVRHDPGQAAPLKIGCFNIRGWMLYRNRDAVFLKLHNVIERPYTDMGCNEEI